MKFIITALLAAVSATVAAQVQIPRTMLCDERDRMFKRISEEYGERPVWIGVSGTHETQLALTVRRDTGEWTLIEFDQTIACVIAVGDKSRLIQGRSI